MASCQSHPSCSKSVRHHISFEPRARTHTTYLSKAHAKEGAAGISMEQDSLAVRGVEAQRVPQGGRNFGLELSPFLALIVCDPVLLLPQHDGHLVVEGVLDYAHCPHALLLHPRLPGVLGTEDFLGVELEKHGDVGIVKVEDIGQLAVEVGRFDQRRIFLRRGPGREHRKGGQPYALEEFHDSIERLNALASKRVEGELGCLLTAGWFAVLSLVLYADAYSWRQRSLGTPEADDVTRQSW